MKTPEAARAFSLFSGRVEKGAEHIDGDLCRIENGQFSSCSGGGMPQISGADLEHIGEKAGTVPGGKFKDKTSGREFIVKVYPKPVQGAVEAATNAIYRAAGFRVPPSAATHGISHQGGKHFGVANEFLPGLKTGDPASVWNARKDLAEGYGVDALMANWDVIGQSHDNIGFVGGKPVRLDNGGSMHFRAQGGAKTFSHDKVDELRTLLDPSMNSRTAKLYGDAFAHDPELKLKALEHVGKITDKQIEHAIHSAGFEKADPSGGKSLAQTLISTIKSRRDIIVHEASKLRSQMAEDKKIGLMHPHEMKALARDTFKAKSPKAMNTIHKFMKLEEGQKLTNDKREQITSALARSLMKDPQKSITLETQSGGHHTMTKDELVYKIQHGWSGSSHDTYAQWFRQAAATYYGRELKDEYVNGEKKWLTKMTPDVIDVVTSIKAASEALFMKEHGLTSRTQSIPVFRGITGDMGKTLNKLAKSLGPGRQMKVQLNALNSFSLSEGTASDFAGYGGVVIKDHMEAQQVWGYGGFGLSGEREVVLGRKATATTVNTEDVIRKALDGIMSLLKEHTLTPQQAALGIVVIEFQPDEPDDGNPPLPQITPHGSAEFDLDPH